MRGCGAVLCHITLTTCLERTAAILKIEKLRISCRTESLKRIGSPFAENFEKISRDGYFLLTLYTCTVHRVAVTLT